MARAPGKAGGPGVRPLRVVLVAGTRPEAIKLAPLVLAARAFSGLRTFFIHTGQHGALFHQALRPFGVRLDAMLNAAVEGLSPDDQAERIRMALPELLAAFLPDLVLVQGDTTSAWAAAHAAHGMGLAVGHVEAGLRSGDRNLPWPEERNRIEIDDLAAILFAPSRGAAANLRRERVNGHIVVTGNTGIDALMQVRPGVAPMLAEPGRHILLTCHRRENQSDAGARICVALRKLLGRAGDRRATVYLHPNPAAAAGLRNGLRDMPAVALVDPVPFPDMIAALDRADLVMSDSGGLQEECAALGTPLLVLRANSERPEVIENGNARLVGTGVRAIVDAAEAILADTATRARMSRPFLPYGAGDAAPRILHAIMDFM